MSIELVMHKRDMYGNIMHGQTTSIKSLDGEDISNFWEAHKNGPEKPKKKQQKQKSK